MIDPEIRTETDTPESHELMRRCEVVNKAICKLAGEVAQPTDMGMWANALAIVSGSMFGMIHQQMRVSEEFDEQAIAAIVENVRQGIKIGRLETLKQTSARTIQ